MPGGRRFESRPFRQLFQAISLTYDFGAFSSAEFSAKFALPDRDTEIDPIFVRCVIKGSGLTIGTRASAVRGTRAWIPCPPLF